MKIITLGIKCDMTANAKCWPGDTKHFWLLSQSVRTIQKCLNVLPRAYSICLCYWCFWTRFLVYPINLKLEYFIFLLFISKKIYIYIYLICITLKNSNMQCCVWKIITTTFCRCIHCLSHTIYVIRHIK